MCAMQKNLENVLDALNGTAKTCCNKGFSKSWNSESVVFLLCRYDFAVYGLLAPEIGSAFFPQSSQKLQLLSSFGVYLAAFLMRPAGAILFGEMGDRIVGRRHALILSILLITIPSILMGCLPTYETWGAFSAFLLVILRMLQGLSVGGQLAGSYVLSIEQSSSKTRGFRGSICDASSVSM